MLVAHSQVAVALAVLSTIFVGGCATTDIADSGCKSFKPITWSRKDTPQTQKEIVGHNRAYDAICKP
jgi:hypothetical protein